MVDNPTVTRRGIWQRIETAPPSFSDPDAFEKFMIEMGFDKDPEQFVRERIQQAIAAAKEVLKRAGHPIVEGVYSKDQNGKHHWIGEVGSDAVVHSPTAIHLSAWPYFLEVSALSIEEFSIRLIRNARRFLKTISNVRDNWQLASMSLYFTEAIYMFRVEHDGIGGTAEKALGSKTGRNKANQGKSKKATDIKDRVHEFALNFLAQSKNSNMKKPSILATLFHNTLPKNSGGKAERAPSTIRRYVDELESEGKIVFPTRPV